MLMRMHRVMIQQHYASSRRQSVLPGAPRLSNEPRPRCDALRNGVDLTFVRAPDWGGAENARASPIPQLALAWQGKCALPPSSRDRLIEVRVTTNKYLVADY